MHKKTTTLSTSWQPVSKWYDKSVGSTGHFYHQNVVIPKVLNLLNLKPDSAVLDLACGQGILERHIPESCTYTGVDISDDLIKRAKAQTPKSAQNSHRFLVGDITKPLPLPSAATFSHATIILALQNVSNAQAAIINLAKHLQPQGTAIIVLNHPAFRIPRHTSWGIEQSNKLQYRRVNRYLSTLKIPITAHPGQKNSAVTWSFHEPLQNYVTYLSKAGLAITNLEEWASPKQSVGKAAAMENRSREEIPLFLCLVAKKLL
jgi:ubiquinone/menaquinone biosynthesis C-methylase UbiE